VSNYVKEVLTNYNHLACGFCLGAGQPEGYPGFTDPGCPTHGNPKPLKPAYDSMVFCEHANECPQSCPCPGNCFCRQPGNMCSTEALMAKHEEEKAYTRVVEAFSPAELAPEQIASEIEKVALSLKKVLSSRLSLRTVSLLIWDSLPRKGRPKRETIEEILKAAANLNTYLVQEKK